MTSGMCRPIWMPLYNKNKLLILTRMAFFTKHSQWHRKASPSIRMNSGCILKARKTMHAPIPNELCACACIEIRTRLRNRLVLMIYYKHWASRRKRGGVQKGGERHPYEVRRLVLLASVLCVHKIEAWCTSLAIWVLLWKNHPSCIYFA